MDGGNDRNPRQAFVEALREILPHLYDPGKLRHSPLLGLLANGSEVRALRDVLVKAIAALQPGPQVPAHAVAWRNYHVLSYRYVEQSTQTEVADELCVSVRQLRRYERAAVAALADSMWRQLDLEGRAEQLLVPDRREEETREAPQDREQELAWLCQSFPQTATSAAELVGSVRRTIAPLADETGVRIVSHVQEGLPPIAGQLAALRQGLINLLTAAVRSAPGGVVQLSGHASEGGLALVVRAVGPPEVGPSPPPAAMDECLAMAGQLVETFGAALTVRTKGRDPGERLYARVTLTQAREVRALCIDDNADALRLFERYLQDTRYRMLPLREAQRTMDIAAEARPDVIVLDVMLPDIDGWELLGRLREHPATRGIPVLVCTILPQEELARTLGAAAFIRKPVSREGLLAALARVLP